MGIHRFNDGKEGPWGWMGGGWWDGRKQALLACACPGASGGLGIALARQGSMTEGPPCV